jgi:hypothetical protein
MRCRRMAAPGVSQDFGLAYSWAGIRTLRLADGPDEVHNRAIARIEFAKHGPTVADPMLRAAEAGQPERRRRRGGAIIQGDTA